MSLADHHGPEDFRENAIDPLNKVGHRCDLLRIKTKTSREFWVDKYLGRSLISEPMYLVRNTETGETWVTGASSIINLY